MPYLAFLDDLLGIGKIADAVNTGEWIAAIFAALAWAVWHPATAAWALGGIIVLAVIRKGWPFSGVPNVDSFAGKALLLTGLVLIIGGFGGRVADEFFWSRPGPRQEAHGEAPGAHSGGVSAPTAPKAPCVPTFRGSC